MKIVLVTGGFDPLHSGHIAYFNAAKDLGDYLVVGVNSDEWLERKKGRSFMPWKERAEIIKALGCVDQVIEFDDSNDSATEAIKYVLDFWKSGEKIIFANGGDRTEGNILEMLSVSDPRLSFKFGVGGEDKKNSSSWILKEWSKPTTERAWGRYTILEHIKDSGWAVKHLEFDAGKSLSDQRHFKRSEHWHVVDGVITMLLEDRNGNKSEQLLVPGDSIDIPVGYWHKAINIDNKPAKVIEVWMGKELTEDDIERRD